MTNDLRSFVKLPDGGSPRPALPFAAAHGAGNVRLFGSTGRGEQGASSDLDLLVDMAEGRTLFDLIALSNELGRTLGSRWMSSPRPACRPMCATAFSPRLLRSAGTRPEPMDVAEAKARLDAILDELAAAGFSVWGWDDESIQIGQLHGPDAECAPRYSVDDPRSR